MKALDGNFSSLPQSICLAFLIWVFVVPSSISCLAMAGFMLMCWLGDGTVVHLDDVDYFMPLPLYGVIVFLWIFVPMVFLGLVAAGVSSIKSTLQMMNSRESGEVCAE
jgi:hypothetical protein